MVCVEWSQGINPVEGTHFFVNLISNPLNPIHDVMTTDVVVATPDDEVESVARTMTERHFRHLPIMDQGKLIGMVSIGDVVKAQRDQFRGEVDTLQTQMIEGR